jgi:Xaa-Pro aminopeptidase
LRLPLLVTLLLAGGCAAEPAVQPAPAPQPAPVLAPPARPLPPLPAGEPIGAAEYAARRQALHARIGEGVLVVIGASEPAHDYLPWAQDHAFRYLTGVLEPGAAYIAVKRGGRVEERLFVARRDPAREVWEGARLGTEGAAARTGLPAFPSDRFLPVLDSLLAVHRTAYVTAPPADPAPGSELSYAQQVLARLAARHPAVELRSVVGEVRALRARKSAAELDRIRRAVHISVLAHLEAMRSTQSGMNEFEIRALLEYIFLRNGADGPAYGSIVGSGPNSTTLHYQAADRFMAAGEVLLIDAGASYGGYAADLTRTFPVNGTYSPEQRAIYEVVLAAQKAAESRLLRGARWEDLRAAADAEIAAGLARLGLTDGPDATYDCAGPGGAAAQCPQFRLFYMHGLGHGVGLAVHDPDISELDGFQPGSAVTIEPGVYVRGDVFEHLPATAGNRALIDRRRAVVARYRDIGVRVEDVYIFDERGAERASAALPREMGEIEAVMREAGLGQQKRRPEIVEWYRRLQGR